VETFQALSFQVPPKASKHLGRKSFDLDQSSRFQMCSERLSIPIGRSSKRVTKQCNQCTVHYRKCPRSWYLSSDHFKSSSCRLSTSFVRTREEIGVTNTSCQFSALIATAEFDFGSCDLSPFLHQCKGQALKSSQFRMNTFKPDFLDHNNCPSCLLMSLCWLKEAFDMLKTP
jgi:hypothetical protein